MFCSKCGNQLNKEDKFCERCGAETQNITQTQVVNQSNNEVNQTNPIHQEFGNSNQMPNDQNNKSKFNFKKSLPLIIGGIVVLLIIISIVNGMVGNSNKGNLNNDSEQIRNEMLEYMNKKYGKTFVGLSLEKRGIDRNSDKLVCYAVGEDREKDYTYVYRDMNGDIATYSDTYFGVIIRNEVETEIKNIFSSFGYEAKVYSDTLTRIYSNEYDKTKTLFNLKSDKTEPGLLVEIAITNTNNTFSENDSQKLFDALSNNEFHGMFTIYYFSKSDFNYITDENENELLNPANENVISSYYRLLHE